MRVIKQLRNQVILITLVTATGVVLYHVLLTKEARKSLANAGAAVVDAYNRISDTIQDMTGIIMEEDVETLPNRESVINQWKAMGF
jgi:hypothetical protein